MVIVTVKADPVEDWESKMFVLCV